MRVSAPEAALWGDFSDEPDESLALFQDARSFSYEMGLGFISTRPWPGPNGSGFSFED